ncbi:hypothetical protein BBO99_00005748 [Phytophthora kernoviae]|uniref:Uncharacterized protein n=2 Tax=Phytophthora kernoviae TaxID=325452 RepID=A0A3R7MV55_9STRA|nr:hypothetical protein G195_006766 [Phytophthora kernoviae 00238/432]KAG2525100.1 hypothetical protein JM18_004775 [Phytophthora kernoviae]KAG2527846.1 hypothetical protein JM16_002983 [Phytophthora kernoviae]RLN43964.1 hypothetical protein BBI17_003374 [Phytophthora kernoviae]RLN78748.1 hypothetical protein BBO99_00005748 [Phytophthora kernoviae]
MRMKRMQLILQKALDVSVHGASLVDLRGPEHHSTEELAAQAMVSLRQKVETVFQWLCETHDVDAELLELEDLIQQAEERRLRQATAAELKDPETIQQEQTEEMQQEQEPEDTTPEARVRLERLRAKQEEQKELEKLVEALEARNKELQRTVEEKRRVATTDVQRMQRAANQLEQVSHLAKDYASAP